jgi:hypothetical protein
MCFKHNTLDLHLNFKNFAKDKAAGVCKPILGLSFSLLKRAEAGRMVCQHYWQATKGRAYL